MPKTPNLSELMNELRKIPIYKSTLKKLIKHIGTNNEPITIQNKKYHLYQH